MQKHRGLFSDPGHTGVLTDIQRCLRLTDLDEIGDGVHRLDFHMLGLFSFRQWSVPEGIGFWMDFLRTVGLTPDTVTIHPDRSSWRHFYESYGVRVELDPECTWSDGHITGYCTEFYLDGVEIGNIVNPLGTCLDCGFGGERLQRLWETRQGMTPVVVDRGEVLRCTVETLLDSGVQPGPRRQGYVLRSLLRELIRGGHVLPDHPDVERELVRRQRVLKSLPGLQRRFPDQTFDYFWETHGVHPDDWEDSGLVPPRTPK